MLNHIIQEEIGIDSFVNSSNIINLSDSVVNKCIEIRRNCKVKTPDTIIAAIAMVHNFILLSRDTDLNRISDFKGKIHLSDDFN